VSVCPAIPEKVLLISAKVQKANSLLRRNCANIYRPSNSPETPIFEVIYGGSIKICHHLVIVPSHYAIRLPSHAVTQLVPLSLISVSLLSPTSPCLFLPFQIHLSNSLFSPCQHELTYCLVILSLSLFRKHKQSSMVHTSAALKCNCLNNHTASLHRLWRDCYRI
jgi:hypothetical protein